MRIKVLYIEDEKYLGKIVTETLEKQGYEVVWETDGAQVIKHLNGSFAKLTIPAEASCFEALGASLYALKNETIAFNKTNLISESKSSFSFHKDLKSFVDKVDFKTIEKNIANKKNNTF